MAKTPIRKDKIRHNSIELRGPLWVPASLKHKYQDYHLKWVGVSDRDSYTLGQYESLGYSFVDAKDLSNTEMGESNLSQSYVEGSKICTGTGAGSKAYLMKVPHALHEEFNESEEERIKERRRQLGEVAKQPGAYGKIDFGDEE